jgi:hypothetical protein
LDKFQLITKLIGRSLSDVPLYLRGRYIFDGVDIVGDMLLVAFEETKLLRE